MAAVAAFNAQEQLQQTLFFAVAQRVGADPTRFGQTPNIHDVPPG